MKSQWRFKLKNIKKNEVCLLEAFLAHLVLSGVCAISASGDDISPLVKESAIERAPLRESIEHFQLGELFSHDPLTGTSRRFIDVLFFLVGRRVFIENGFDKVFLKLVISKDVAVYIIDQVGPEMSNIAKIVAKPFLEKQKY